MATYTPFGTTLLAECLSVDPFGTVHRGIARPGAASGPDVLVRRYHEVWLANGLLDRQSEIRRNLILLGGVSLFHGMHLALEEAPHFVWPLCRGRSLASVLKAAEAQGIPFGIDPAMFLVWVLTHHIRQLHGAKQPLGFLSPHRVWVGFDGLVELLDAPVIGILTELVPRVPGARELLDPYSSGPRQEGIMHDAFQLGALLFEMVVHQPLRTDIPLRQVLEAARHPAHEGPEPLPEALVDILGRLLGLGKPFTDLEQLEGHLEDALFGTDTFNPTTFGIAFIMHTLFRREIEEEKETMDSEQGEAVRASLREEAAPAPDKQAAAAPDKQAATAAAPTVRRKGPLFRRVSTLAAAAVLVGVVVLGAMRIQAGSHQAAPAASRQAVPQPGAPQPGGLSPVAPSPVAPAPAAPVPAPAAPVPGSGEAGREAASPVPAPVRVPEPIAVSPDPSFPKGVPVRLRVFVDERGRVRQALVLEGALKGSSREAAALALAMEARPGSGAGREWAEITVHVK